MGAERLSADPSGAANQPQLRNAVTRWNGVVTGLFAEEDRSRPTEIKRANRCHDSKKRIRLANPPTDDFFPLHLRA